MVSMKFNPANAMFRLLRHSPAETAPAGAVFFYAECRLVYCVLMPALVMTSAYLATSRLSKAVNSSGVLATGSSTSRR